MAGVDRLVQRTITASWQFAMAADSADRRLCRSGRGCRRDVL
jgi:hypothetical protein